MIAVGNSGPYVFSSVKPTGVHVVIRSDNGFLSEVAVTPTPPFPRRGPRVMPPLTTSRGGEVQTLDARFRIACVCAHGSASGRSAAIASCGTAQRNSENRI